ncbi:DNA oxidative demethylase AlkB [Nitrospirillum iridis]|uniref:Alpha-ketoglutarate-dependent dioxygenase AlkB n=1 Tax=Nitrospirillum iridis TaxID=765888 RepID=A0A7X0AYN5_9PROT|nr:DNA oxidative demethylase AlkB [Nitrospirillum iridis]MBB6251004.1 alkylated DNA repair protein (DNA oxidative demethylase) [Nitrospirillum iridis]
MTGDLLAGLAPPPPTREEIGPGAVRLRGWALPRAVELLAAVEAIAAAAPFRHMVTPGGFEMSVAMTNCGAAGWVTDRAGYRYAPDDPLTGRPWPPLPVAFGDLAQAAAGAAGYRDFQPDACLINRYEPRARLTLHQDRDERDKGHPIVSLSLGLPAIFQFGGLKRADPVRRVTLLHGDVVVWGGAARLFHHGVLPLKDGTHPLLGKRRVNLTLRRAW